MKSKALREFILQYKSEPCLWNKNHPGYYNRKSRIAAYEKMTVTLNEIVPGATKKDVVRKIDSLRSSYKRQRFRIRQSISSGETVFQPSLWYYKLMTFLNGQDANKNEYAAPVSPKSITGSELGDEEPIIIKVEAPQDASDEDCITTNFHDPSPPTSTISSQTISKKCKITNLKLEFLENSPHSNSSQSTKDDNAQEKLGSYELFGRYVAQKLNGLSKRHALLVEKKITDLLFVAEIDHLKSSTVDESPSQSPTHEN